MSEERITQDNNSAADTRVMLSRMIKELETAIQMAETSGLDTLVDRLKVAKQKAEELTKSRYA